MKLFLSSYEFDDFDKPRKLLSIEKINLDDKLILMAEIENPIIGQKYGLLDKDISVLYLICRVDKDAFIKLNKFPIDVHVLISNKSSKGNVSSLDDLQLIAWACLYNNQNDADMHRVI